MCNGMAVNAVQFSRSDNSILPSDVENIMNRICEQWKGFKENGNKKDTSTCNHSWSF